MAVKSKMKKCEPGFLAPSKRRCQICFYASKDITSATATPEMKDLNFPEFNEALVRLAMSMYPDEESLLSCSLDMKRRRKLVAKLEPLEKLGHLLALVHNVARADQRAHGGRKLKVRSRSRSRSPSRSRTQRSSVRRSLSLNF